MWHTSVAISSLCSHVAQLQLAHMQVTWVLPRYNEGKDIFISLLSVLESELVRTRTPARQSVSEHFEL